MRKPKWDIDKARGEKAEALVMRMRSAIASGTLEVKCDDRAGDTGNVYVERQCLTAEGWKPSGIDDPGSRAAGWVWVLLDMRVIFWMPKWLMRNLADEYGKPSACPYGTHPTRGVLVPLDCLMSGARAALNRYDETEKAA